MADQQAGWYPDPSGNASMLRYWDGVQWTDDFTNSETAAPAQPPGQLEPQLNEPYYYSPYNNNQAYYQPAASVPVDNNKQGLRMAAFVLNVVITVISGIFIIPLAWMIPMTIHSWGIYKGTKRNTVAFGVCTLLFLSLISGILLLVSGEDN